MKNLFNNGYGIFLLRLFVGVRLIYGTLDNIASWARMTEFRDFLAGYHFPLPMVSAVTSVYAQFICGLLFIIGWKTRWAAAVMLFNFFIALVVVHRNDPFINMTPALAMFFCSLLLLLDGPGKISVDARKRG